MYSGTTFLATMKFIGTSLVLSLLEFVTLMIAIATITPAVIHALVIHASLTSSVLKLT